MGTSLTGSRSRGPSGVVVIAKYIIWNSTVGVQGTASSCRLEVSGVLTNVSHVEAIIHENNSLIAQVHNLLRKGECSGVALKWCQH